MNKILIQNSMLCANEFALAIALTVFILITVILALLLIFLAASKNFRTVFFREKPQKKKSSKKHTQNTAVSEPMSQGVDTIPIEPVSTPKPRKAATRRADAAPEYLNAIPTVPLGGIPVPNQPSPRPRGRRAVAEDAVSEAIAQESGSTYTTRSITITRARSTRQSQSKTEQQNNRNDKKK